MAELRQNPTHFVPAGIGATARVVGDDKSAPASLIEQPRILSLLYDIGKELTSILDLESLLRAVGERVKLLVDHDVFNVMLLNPETQRLEHALSLRYDQRLHPRITLALGEGLCGAAALERRPIRVDRVSSDPRYIQCEIAWGVESELVVPLIVKDRVLGVLDLESVKPGAFTEVHEQMLTTLASSLSIALENARLYDQLRRTEQSKKEDLERAREVQQLLLPVTLPQAAGIEIAVRYEPARELGGDFYQFLPYGDDRIAVAVGDVAGKGSAAALLATLGVGLLREHAVHLSSPPAEMLTDLNGHIQVPGRHGRFIAMVFGVYDIARRELCLANAGFPPPMLVRENRATSVPVRGVPLGLFPDSSYDSLCLRLQPGDIVVFCSDGIHEQTNDREEQFGLERLISCLTTFREDSTADQIAQGILTAIEEHAGPATCHECSDDRTIVVLRVADSDPEAAAMDREE